MKVERWDGSEEGMAFNCIEEMMAKAEKRAKDPDVKRITLSFPKMRIPGKRRKR